MERKFYKTDFFPKAILSIRKRKLTHPFLLNICGKRLDFFFVIFPLSCFLKPFFSAFIVDINYSREEKGGKGKGKEEGRHTHNGDGRRSIGRRRGGGTFFSARSRKEMGIRRNGPETSLFPPQKNIVALFLQHFFCGRWGGTASW